ncbi:oxidoreductase [Variovorax sp. WS11]|uniref:SDR family NAD(P)-dependent oxidoreductase n=1 Tax=Variovorax sp. WS11 TaxID=1105204 RepID=UPI000D0E1E24|nr:glucose 1-dehydrogenase [Variovorax sp. WS11]NDZ18957.1 glucose 1-dehydrogenase [Variovorax sp. WS11]PSL82465.1 oxidoreductase [Variovorax sp. WS11]
MGKLDGKVALITGGSSGIGLASAKRFVAEGARVIIVSPRSGAVEAAVAEIGERAFGYTGDVGRLEDLDRIYADVERRFGKIDVLFANAGVIKLEPLGGVSEESYDRQFDINTKGVFFTVQKALPILRDGGSILLCSSIAHFTGTAYFHVYAGTKAAVRAFARNWAIELKDRKIRVNCLSPAVIETPLAFKMGISPEALPDLTVQILSQMPMGRAGRVDEAAAAALFLVSEESSFITGTDLCVDGGLGQI